MNTKQQLGAAGELRARRYLEAKGYRFVAANVRMRFGEVDLVMRDGKTLVFVEVKTRRFKTTGFGEEAVDWRKLSHIQRVAEAYRKEMWHRGQWRIDVLAIGREGVRHVKNVTVD